MIQTHLLKSDPPYQIIACRGEVGVQVATLVVTEETRSENGDYGITTHSHPVVCYMDKSLTRKRLIEKSGDADDFSIVELAIQSGEGVVWDKVECSECTVVSFTDIDDRRLSPHDFFYLAGAMLEDIACGGQWRGHRLMDFAARLADYGFSITDDPEKEHHFTLMLSRGNYTDFGEQAIVDHDQDDYPMPVPVMEPELMLRWFKTIVRQYNLILGKEHRFYFKSLYEPPYHDDALLDDDFDPDHLTAGQQACNTIAKLLTETDLYSGLH